MAILKLLGGILVSVFLGLVKDEAKAWLPKLTNRILANAVKTLPHGLQLRYEEEWRSDIEEMPGEIGKMLRAVGLVRAAYGIRRANRGEFRGVVAEWVSRSIAALLLVWIAPCLGILMLIVRGHSYGPVFLRIPYRDWDGRCFRWWHFRSFVLLKIDGVEYAANSITLQRIATTFSGVLLLRNVARGEMTLSSAARYMLWKVKFGAVEIPKPQPPESVIQ